MAEKVLTAPLAVIRVDGEPVGLMKNIRATENFRRGKVSGLGALVPSELPALEWSGQLSCGFYHISPNLTGIPKAMIRDVPTLRAWIDNVLLQEDGVDVVVFKRTKTQVNAETGLTEGELVPVVTIRGLFADRESFDIAEGQISGKDQEFTYLTPVLNFI